MKPNVKQKSVVIQLKQPLIQEFGAIGIKASPFRDLGLNVSSDIAHPDINISIEDLDNIEQEDIRRDPNTLAVAGNMPLRLIEPTRVLPNSENGAWGIEAVEAHQSPFDGTGVTIAVLDTGIDPNHPAFQGMQLIRKNYTDEVDDDIHGHGTHCAGTIFGRDVNGVRIGIAQGVNKAIIGKVLGQGGGGSIELASAIQWAMNEGANIISMSLGIDFPGHVQHLIHNLGVPVEPATSFALEQYRANVNLFNQLAGLVSAQQLFGKSGIIVAAAGNESKRNSYEIAVAPPACATGITAVGAVAKKGNLYEVANFSNTKPNIVGPGVDILSAKLGGGLTCMSGTSMATPHVAGVAALWAQKISQVRGAPDASSLQAKLIASGDLSELTHPTHANDIGNGLVKAPH